MLTYVTRLLPQSQEDFDNLLKILEMEQFVFNFASAKQFGAKKNSLILLHNQVYHKIKKLRADILSQVIIKGEQACLAAYKGIKSNKHKINKPIEKKKLSIRLDKRLYSKPSYNSIRITTVKGRKLFRFVVYPKLKSLIDQYQYKDPLIFEKNGELWISLVFDVKPLEIEKQNLSLGVDLGIRVAAACSDGRLVVDKQYNKEKRKLRFLKRKLQSNKSKSAKRKLKKLKHKEYNKSKNQTNLIVNEILKTNSNVIVVEDLEKSKMMKKKKKERKSCRTIAQVPLFNLIQILTYKAQHMGKTVIAVNPAYTSQTDSVTGKREGERRGRRFYAKNGLVYDADINAAVNIAKKSKLPCSCGNILDGAGRIVNLPTAKKISNT